MSTSKSMTHTKDLVVSTRQCIKVRSGRTYCLNGLDMLGISQHIAANRCKSKQDTRKVNKKRPWSPWWGDCMRLKRTLSTKSWFRSCYFFPTCVAKFLVFDHERSLNKWRSTTADLSEATPLEELARRAPTV